MLSLFEEYFATITDNTSSYEISSNTVESADDDIWVLEAYFTDKPDADTIYHDIQQFLKIAAVSWEYADTLSLEQVDDIDWVRKMQDEFKPLHIGQFYITNLVHNDECDAGNTKIIIEATRAFGTGEHATTSGCLIALEKLKHNGLAPERVLDVGTGSGILAIASSKLWSNAQVMATDIDRVAVAIAQEHARINNAEIEFYTADGISQILKDSTKPDLIISNILACTLINFAAEFAQSLSDGGIVVLSGFLDYQLPSVIEAYNKAGFVQTDIIDRDKWMTIVCKLS